MQVGRKIYFDIDTGDVIQDTGEKSGAVVQTTQDQDFASYIALSERVRDSVGVLQFAYGQYTQDFTECTGYRVNPQTLELKFSYPDPNAPESPPVYQKPLSEEVEELRQRDMQMQGDITAIIEGLLGGV